MIILVNAGNRTLSALEMEEIRIQCDAGDWIQIDMPVLPDHDVREALIDTILSECSIGELYRRS
jgi:hypothetical protein